MKITVCMEKGMEKLSWKNLHLFTLWDDVPISEEKLTLKKLFTMLIFTRENYSVYN